MSNDNNNINSNDDDPNDANLMLKIIINSVFTLLCVRHDWPREARESDERLRSVSVLFRSVVVCNQGGQAVVWNRVV